MLSASVKNNGFWVSTFMVFFAHGVLQESATIRRKILQQYKFAVNALLMIYIVKRFLPY